MSTALVWIIGLAVAILSFAIFGYNRLIRLRNRVVEAWSGVDVQLKRRHDLIPNLVEAVKAYQSHERRTLDEITRQRSLVTTADSVAATAACEARLQQNLEKLILRAEAYPELKADENFRQLTAELVATEDALQYARRYYNGAVRDLNNAVESFPLNLLARPVGFHIAEFFIAEQAERSNIAVDL